MTPPVFSTKLSLPINKYVLPYHTAPSVAAFNIYFSSGSVRRGHRKDVVIQHLYVVCIWCYSWLSKEDAQLQTETKLERQREEIKQKHNGKQ